MLDYAYYSPRAQEAIVSLVQATTFGSDVTKKSIARFKPFVEGRLENAEMLYTAKHPVILLCNHPATGLFIRHYHDRLGHVSHDG